MARQSVHVHSNHLRAMTMTLQPTLVADIFTIFDSPAFMDEFLCSLVGRVNFLHVPVLL